MWSPKDKISLGLNINKTYLTSANTKVQVTRSSVPSDTTNATVGRAVTESTKKRDIPLNIRFGGAYFANESLMFSADLSYHEGIEDEISGKREAVLDWAMGGEYYFNPSWAVRGGLFSNNANTPQLSETGVTPNSLQAEHVDLLGFSASISHFSRNSILTLGINNSFGSGKAQLFPADTNGNANLRDVDITTFTLFLSATYAY
jgi:long-chain fatty acid transport protein